MIRHWSFLTTDLELTNACHQTCQTCPRQSITRPHGQMTRPIFQNVAQQLIATGSRVTLSGLGDPLLHPHWMENLSFFRQHGGCAGLQINVASLTPLVAKQIQMVRPHFVYLSVPSLHRDILARIIPQREPPDLLAAAVDFVRTCRGQIPVTVVGTRTLLEPSTAAHEFVAFWLEHGAHAWFPPCHCRGGRLHRPDLATPVTPTTTADPCGLFAQHAFVTWQGEVLACCHDLTGETRVGNLVTSGVDRVAARKRTLLAQRPHFPLCRRCDESLRHLPIPVGAPPQTRSARARHFRRLRRYFQSAPQ